jgi:hypothetical protein
MHIIASCHKNKGLYFIHPKIYWFITKFNLKLVIQLSPNSI